MYTFFPSHDITDSVTVGALRPASGDHLAVPQKLVYQIDADLGQNARVLIVAYYQLIVLCDRECNCGQVLVVPSGFP